MSNDACHDLVGGEGYGCFAFSVSSEVGLIFQDMMMYAGLEHDRMFAKAPQNRVLSKSHFVKESTRIQTLMMSTPQKDATNYI